MGVLNRSYLRSKMRPIAESNLFNNLTTFIILGYGVILGIRTFFTGYTSWDDVFNIIDYFVTIYFTIEIIIKLLAEDYMIDFFKDGWNIFDFIIVLAAIVTIPIELFLHTHSSIALSARLFRIFRVFRILRIFNALPELRKIVTSLIAVIPTILDIMLVLFIIFYIFAVMGSMLFGGVDPKHWGNFLLSMLSLVKILTFDDWFNQMEELDSQVPGAWAFFVSFIFFAAIIFFNFFVAIMIDKMQAVEAEQRKKTKKATKKALEEVKAELQKDDDKLDFMVDKLKLLTDNKSTETNKINFLVKTVHSLNKQVSTLKQEIKEIKDKKN